MYTYILEIHVITHYHLYNIAFSQAPQVTMTFPAPTWSNNSPYQHSPIPYNLKSCILKYKASTAACTG